MALTDNIVNYWRFDEASGNAADAVNSKTLTNNNTTPYAAGKINNAASFTSGSSQYFNSSDNTVVDVGAGDASWSFWYNSASAATSAVFFSKRVTATGQGYYCLIDASDRVFFEPAGSSGTHFVDVRGTTDIANGAWHHIVVTWANPSTAKIYVDGADETVVLTPDTLDSLTNTIQFNIGAENSPGQYIDGLMDEFGFWSRALSGSEVSQLYNAGAGLSYPFTATAVIHNLALLGVGN